MTDYPVRSSSTSGSGAGSRTGGAASSFGSGAASAGEDLQAKLSGGVQKVLDGIEPHLDKLPEGAQGGARKAVGFARERPLLTLAGLALGAVVLLNGGRRR